MAKLESGDGKSYSIMIDGVVSELHGEVWRIIPWTNNRIISNYGRCAKRISWEKYTLLEPRELKTYKGFYYTYSGIGKNNNEIPVHRVVCEIFNGKPENETLDVNHKDSNKINNYYKNLEWMTRSDNVLHAYNEGLCKVGVRVEAKNLRTSEVKQFNTLSEAARFFGIPRHEFKRRIAYSVSEPYLKEWVFNLDYESDRNVIRKHVRQAKVMCMDYVTKTVIFSETMSDLAIKTGVSYSSIFYITKDENKDKLIRGYVFRQQHILRPWPVYTKAEIEKSASARDIDKGKKWINVIAKNYTTGEVKEARSLLSMVELLSGEKTGSEIGRCRFHWINKKAAWVLDWLILGKADFKAWPEINQEEIALRSHDSFDTRKTVIEVTDLTENTTKVFSSMRDFAKSVGVKNKAVIYAVSRNKLLRERYSIKVI